MSFNFTITHLVSFYLAMSSNINFGLLIFLDMYVMSILILSMSTHYYDKLDCLALFYLVFIF